MELMAIDLNLLSILYDRDFVVGLELAEYRLNPFPHHRVLWSDWGPFFKSQPRLERLGPTSSMQFQAAKRQV